MLVAHGRPARRAYLQRVKLRDVVDLETQLALDEGQDDGALRTRDRGLYLALSPAPGQPDALLAAWLEQLRVRFGAPRAGERVESAQRVLGYVLALLGLTMGWATAELLLHYEQGGAPVNVGHYLLVLVFGQLATLVLLALSLLLRRAFSRLPVVGDVSRLLRFAASRMQRLLPEGHPAGEQLAAQQVNLQRVRTRLGLYQALERYLLLSQSQLFALAFNLGALASCLRLILLSDLAFAWSTSVTALDAAQVQRVCAVLAWPFAWLVPEAVPSLSLIEHTQYFRLEGRFAGAPIGSRGDPALVGQWWRFLVACTVTYGLVPRLLTFALFRRGIRRAQQDVPLDTPAVQRVLSRLTTPELSTRARDPQLQAAEPARPVQSADGDASGPVALVLYRDVPTLPDVLAGELSRCLGLQVTSVHRVGGFDVQADSGVCAALGRQARSVCLVAEAWEAPDKSLRGFLATLRQALGPRRSVRVVLIGEASERGFTAPMQEDVRVFKDRLTLLDDPYLSVETLPDVPARDVRPEEVRA
jgi:hypothetical protein